VFTVGHLRTKPWSKVFPLRYSDQNTDGELKIAGTLGFISNEMRSRVYEENSICPALSTMQGGYTQPMILQKSRGFNDGGLHEIAPTLTKNSWEHNNHLVDDASGISKTIRCGGKGSPYGGKQCWDTYNIQGKIRKLTPKECWRLQGVSDEITDKVIQAGISDSQMYRGAGDACTVNVIYEIAKKLT
jgi:DNA (cytosine-5)-methyltransferase 1